MMEIASQQFEMCLKLPLIDYTDNTTQHAQVYCNVNTQHIAYGLSEIALSPHTAQQNWLTSSLFPV